MIKTNAKYEAYYGGGDFEEIEYNASSLWKELDPEFGGVYDWCKEDAEETKEEAIKRLEGQLKDIEKEKKEILEELFKLKGKEMTKGAIKEILK